MARHGMPHPNPQTALQLRSTRQPATWMGSRYSTPHGKQLVDASSTTYTLNDDNCGSSYDTIYRIANARIVRTQHQGFTIHGESS